MMRRRGNGGRATPPVKDCNHAYGMTFDYEVCYCEHCGQTWKMLFNRETDAPRGWFPLPMGEASYGSRHSYA